MKEIAQEFRNLLEQTEIKGTFRIYKKRSYLGNLILSDLIKKRDGDYKKGDNIYHGFYLNDRSKDVGLLSQLYGASGLFTLVNRYNVLDETKENDQLVRSIKSSVLDVLEYVEKNGYDLNPYLDEKTNSLLFHENDNEYIGAMTWALSLFVSTRKAIRNGIINFNYKAEESDQEQFKHRLNVQIKFIIQFFLDNVINDENGFGWGYANGCIDPSIFFTYSVIEAYSDFEDNAITDEDNELLDFLNEGISKEEDRLEIRYRNLCFAIGDRTWFFYKNYLKNSFFSDKFNGEVEIISKEEILKTSRSSVLFNSLYILFILFYSYTNSRDEIYDEFVKKIRLQNKEPEFRTEEEKNDVVNTLTRCLQLIQNFYEDLIDSGNSSIVDKHIISFNQRNTTMPEISKMLNEESIQASSFLPMLVKANNLVAYYILQFPQKSMTDLFDEILNAKNKESWLWENRRFDLLSTERYIEAIADYFDYYDSYEKNYASKALDAEILREELTAKITAKNDKRFAEELEKEKVQQIQIVRKEIEESIRSEYIIEPQINKKIESFVKNEVQNSLKFLLIDTLNNITKSQRVQIDKNINVEPLNKFEVLMKETLESFIKGYFANSIRNVNANYDVGTKKLEKATFDDLKEFMDSYVDFVARNVDERYEKGKLSDLFDLLENRK